MAVATDKIQAQKNNDKAFKKAHRAVTSGKMSVVEASEKYGINGAAYYSRAKKLAPTVVEYSAKAPKPAKKPKIKVAVFAQPLTLVTGSPEQLAAYAKALANG